MKTQKLILISFFTFFTFQLSAQISVGFKAGYTRAWEKYDVDVPEDARIHVTGFNISGMVYLKINDHLSLGIEPGYVERGAACVPGWNAIDPGFRGDTELFLKYAELPIMAQGQLPLLKGRLEVFGKVGYGMAYLTTAFEKITDLDGIVAPTRSKLDLSSDDRLNRLDHGIHGTIGLSKTLGKGRVFIETAFYSSVRNADRNNFSRNRNLNFNLGYLLSL
ncbi:hypothetical protein [Roseivirga sp. E12]|uniref:hypothetical protein n=1 Tax=Roseivirga sp. E12 TaxID=2819237 RepID=UPI001ABC6855|nr:hypothetical protein [Roseivirga sp. E12]MBO3697784.1 hypothetical protein [Roseivirga sp. E12]